jgi:alkylated DNA repair dioxygenase AlkB
MQLSLLGREAPSFDASFSGLARTELAGGAWIEHLPGWIRGHATLFDELVDGLTWKRTTQTLYEKQVETPRLIATLGDEEGRFPFLAEISRALTQHAGVTLDRITFALYRSGSDSVAWHRDRHLRQKEEGVVATVSLGEPRTFMMRPRGGGGESLRFSLGHGDLFIMGGTANKNWEHSVPKVRSLRGPRLSIMFRHVDVD